MKTAEKRAAAMQPPSVRRMVESGYSWSRLTYIAGVSMLKA